MSMILVLLISRKFMRDSKHSPPIISFCLLSYPNTNYCFLPLCDRKVGDAFLSRLMPSIIHTQHPQTIFLFAIICEFLSSVSALCIRNILTEDILWSISNPNRKRSTAAASFASTDPSIADV